jgi:hypothetical protein
MSVEPFMLFVPLVSFVSFVSFLSFVSFVPVVSFVPFVSFVSVSASRRWCPLVATRDAARLDSATSLTPAPV